MKASVKIEWLLPFQDRGELTALDYEKAFMPPLPRRTAINRLNRLRDLGWIQRVGETRATVYFLTSDGQVRLSAIKEMHSSDVISNRSGFHSNHAPLSLDTYLPNITFYLPESVRKELFILGGHGVYDSPLRLRWKIDLCWNSLKMEGFFTTRSEVEAWLQTDSDSSHETYLDEKISVHVGRVIEFLLDWKNHENSGNESITSLHMKFGDHLSFLGDIPSVQKLELIMSKASAIEDPVEQSFFLLLQFMVILPSSPSHGFIAPMVANLPLFRNGMVPQSFVGIAGNAYRSAITALRAKGEMLPLRDLFVQTYRQSILRNARVADHGER
jgi:hypothetical protein